MLNNITDAVSNLSSLKYQMVNFNNVVLVTDVYGFSSFNEEMKQMINKTKGFANELRDTENSRFKYGLAILVIIPTLSLIALIAYFFKWNRIILVVSVCLFMIIIPNFIVMALNTSFFFLSIDICDNVNKIVTNYTIPISGEGIGYYISCPSKVI